MATTLYLMKEFPFYLISLTEKICFKNRILLKRHFYHFCGHFFISYFDKNLSACCSIFQLNISHSNRLTQRRRLRAARDMSNDFIVPVQYFITVPWDTFLHQFYTYQLSFYPLSFLFLQNLLSDKIFIEFCDPPQARFQRRGGIINVIPIQAIPHFQS